MHRRRSPRLRISTVVAVVVLLTVAGCASDADSTDGQGQPPLKVGLFQLSQAELLDEIIDGFKTQLTDELAPREIVFDLKNAQGDHGLVQSIAQQFASSDNDLFAVAGTPGIIALAQMETRKPIIGLAMTDPVKAKVAKSLDASQSNVTGSLGFIEPPEILAQLVQITPMPRRIGTIYDPSNEASRIWTESFRQALSSRPDITLVEATIASSGDITAAARSLVGRSDLWIIPPDTTVIAGMPAVGGTAMPAKVPLIITAGDASTAGVLASVGPDYAQLGRLAAGTAARAVRGEDPATIPFVRPTGATWEVNQTTLSALSITLPSVAFEQQSGTPAGSAEPTPSSSR
ncbi:ABC transporter substrate-binding protein [Micromonospora sp. FIMYZ51]|uniref:ABC transporter substrate-binding protein n=1 Tax=Micromonospora sp. FIMYZ51 TaxID=3051832 RepID=UPI00311F86C8